MKTRQRGRADGVPTDYSKDMIDPRDLGDDGDDTNGYYDDKADDAVRARGNTRTAREGGNRRGGRVARGVNMRSKADKNLIESAEFQEVVKGFFDFIDEIKRKKGRGPKPGPPKSGKPTDGSDLGPKKIKTDPLSMQAQPGGKSELLLEEEKNDKNSSLYSFNSDVNSRKDLLDKTNKNTNLLSSLQTQEEARGKGGQATQKEAPTNKPAMGNYLPSANLPPLNPAAAKQPANKTLQSLYYENPALFQGIGGFPGQNFAGQDLRNIYMSPYDNYPYNLSPNQLLNLQLLESLLQKNPPNLLGSLLDPGQAPGFYDLQRDLQQYRAPQQLGLGANQRFGLPGLGNKLAEAEAEPNPKGFEGKLGRAATHVAIAYFIYFKSLDPESISRSDKTKMDPTYNARMLKEKRTEPYPNEIPSMMSGKMANYYGGMEVENGYQPNVEYLERQIMEGQRLFRNPELNQALAAYQGKPGDQKLEEEKAADAVKRKAAEASKQGPKRQPKEEDIIEINENSDNEVEEQKPKEANNKAEQAKGSEKAEEKVVSAEDIVQKITELTGHSGGDGGDKRKNARKPAGKNAEEAGKGPASQKGFAVAEEGKTPISHTNVKENKQKEEPKTIEVISSDDAVVEEKPKEDKVAVKEEKKESQEKKEDQEMVEKAEKVEEIENVEKMEEEVGEGKDVVKTESTSVNPHTEDKEEKVATKPE